MNVLQRIFSLIALLFFQLWYCALPAPAYSQDSPGDEEQEKAFLNMFGDQMVVTPTRSPKPLSQVAENITVITAREIGLSGAHTLAEVINNVTGVQVFLTGGPGSIATVYLQGSEARHVTVVIDGIIINNLSDNIADPSMIPVQNIERIEIIKGPASSTWGSALGGVINIITKSADTTKTIKGDVSASYGERSTGDLRSEVYGRLSRFGYYMYAGRFHSDGFRPHNETEINNFYTKLDYHGAGKTDAVFSLGYNEGDRGEYALQNAGIDSDTDFRNLRTSLNVATEVADNMMFSLSGYALRQNFERFKSYIANNREFLRNFFKDSGYGGSAKLNWQLDTHTIVIGSDYDTRTATSNALPGGRQRLTRSAVFINDTITVRRLTVTPGLRYDNTSTNGDFTSPSLGATYKVSNGLLLRAYAARGFHIPPLSYTYGNAANVLASPGLRVEKVFSYQAGVETTWVPYVNLKVMVFHHRITDALDSEVVSATARTRRAVNKDKERRRGIEVELNTVPIYNFSLAAGAAFIGARDIGNDIPLLNTPQYTYDFGIKYDDNDTLKALLKGHYIWWNDSTQAGGKYNAMIVDFTVAKVLARNRGNTLETFFSVNNILNGTQYALLPYKNPGRWVEGGIRASF